MWITSVHLFIRPSNVCKAANWSLMGFGRATRLAILHKIIQRSATGQTKVIRLLLLSFRSHQTSYILYCMVHTILC